MITLKNEVQRGTAFEIKRTSGFWEIEVRDDIT